MSSHHIVRDAQEPALLILNGDFNTEMLHQLLEWSPTVVVLETILAGIVQLGIKSDVIIIKNPENKEEIVQDLLHQYPFTILESDEESLYPIIFNYLKEKDHTALNILGSLSIDTYTHLVHLHPYIQLVLYTDQSFIYPIKNDFSKWLPQNCRFKIIAATKKISIANTDYNADKDLYTVSNDGHIDFSHIPLPAMIEQYFN